MPSKPSLSEMPEVVMSKILEGPDFRSIQALRKVSPDLRNFIDDVKPNASLYIVEVSVNPDKIYVDYHCRRSLDRYRIEYRNHEKGCLIVYGIREPYGHWFRGLADGGKEKLLENENFIKIFLKDFELIMQNQKSILNEFHLAWRDTIEGTQFDELTLTPIIDGIKNILESRERHLKVRHLTIHIIIEKLMKQSHFMSILPFLDPETLYSIKVYGPVLKDDLVRMMEIDEIAQLDQWKNAGSIRIENCIIPTSIQHLAHTSKAWFTIQTISCSDLVFLLKKFLRSLTPDQFKFKFVNFEDNLLNMDLFNAPFMYNDSNDNNHIPNRKYWFFLNPNTDRIVELIYDPDISRFIFSHVELSKVPMEARIKNVHLLESSV